MPHPEKEFYYRKDGKREDAELHNPILEAGDFAAAKKISDQVARDIGLTEAEIEALSATPQNVKGKPNANEAGKR